MLAYLSKKSGITDLIDMGAPISFFSEMDEKQFYIDICKIKNKSYYYEFLIKNKIFIEKYKRKSSILKTLELI